MLLTACDDRRLRHWDVRISGGKPMQTYEFHQSSVNTCEFCDFGEKFVSTGDDRKLLVWDWCVPSPVKIISDIWVPSMPTAAVHPSSLRFAAVGLNSRVYTFQVNKTTGLVRKSMDFCPPDFSVAGYACEPGYSQDGQVLALGDGKGKIHITKSRMKPDATVNDTSHAIQVFPKAHAPGTPVTCVQWHPCFDGVFLSCGWDGKMNLWM